MDKKQLTLILLSLLLCKSLFAVDKATVIIRTKDGQTETRLIQARKVGENTNRIVVPVNSIPDNFDTLDILADNAVAEKGEKGFWIFPRGEMGTFKLDNGRYLRQRNQMPIYGVQTPRETFLAIIKGLQLENWLIVEAENGNYRICPRWQSDYIGFKPYEDIVIDFITLKGKDANYSGMGRAYRKYQLNKGIVKPFKERMKNNPALQQIATAMPHRIEPHCIMVGDRHKKEDFTPETAPAVRPVLPFTKAKKFIDAFKAAGMKDVHFIDAGWQSGGYDGKCPQILPIDECIGGEMALKDFVKYTQSQGYQLCSNSNHTDAYRCSDMWDPDYVLKRLDGSLYRAGPLNGGWMYYICPKRTWELFVKKQLEQTRELGYKGILYIDVFSALPPVPNFDKDHPSNRKEQAVYQNKILAYAKELFGGSASECGFDHCIQNLDFVNYLGRHMLNGEGVRKDAKGKPRVYDKMIDRIAPLWEIVYHGITLSNPDKFTQGYLPKGSAARLRLIEFGGRPIFYSASYSSESIARYKEMYELFQPLKHLQTEFIEENRALAPNVFLTRYSDGSEIVTNYSQKSFSYKNKSVAARDYKLFNTH